MAGRVLNMGRCRPGVCAGLGPRCSALGVDSVPGIGSQVPGIRPSGSVLGARYPTLGHGRMRGKGDTTFPASFVQAEGRTPNPVPGTWYLAPVPHSHLSNLNAVLLLC
jgi:hypothetical protein